MQHTVTSNTSSNQQKETIYQTATGATTLGDLRHWDGSALSGYNFVLSTTSDAGNQNVTLAFSATTTLHQVIDRLADYGINANIAKILINISNVISVPNWKNSNIQIKDAKTEISKT